MFVNDGTVKNHHRTSEGPTVLNDGDKFLVNDGSK